MGARYRMATDYYACTAELCMNAPASLHSDCLRQYTRRNNGSVTKFKP